MVVRTGFLAIGCLGLVLGASPRNIAASWPGVPGENALAFAPDGKWLVTAGDRGLVRIRDGTTGAIVAGLVGHTARVNGVAVSPDGRTVATVADDASTRLWDVERRAERRVLLAPLSPQPRPTTMRHGIPVVCPSPMMRILAATPRKHRRTVKALLARVNVLTHGMLSAVIEPKPPSRAWVRAVAFAPDGRTVATGDADGTLRLWDVESGDPRGVWWADRKWVTQVLYSPNGATIASVGFDRVIKLWDARSHLLRLSLPYPEEGVDQMAYSPDGSTLAVALGRETSLLDAVTGREKDRLVACSAYALAFTPDGRYLAVADVSAIYLIDIDRLRNKFAEHRTFVDEIADAASSCRLAVSPDGRWFAQCFSRISLLAPKQNFKLVGIRSFDDDAIDRIEGLDLVLGITSSGSWPSPAGRLSTTTTAWPSTTRSTATSSSSPARSAIRSRATP